MRRARRFPLTFKQLTGEALKLLRPADRNACEADIKNAFDEIFLPEMAHVGGLPRNVRKAFKAHLDAAKRFQVTQKKMTEVKAYLYLRIGQQPHLAADIEILTQALVLRRPPLPVPTLQAAAIAARDLLEKYGRRVTTTKDGDWCKLAAILYGDPDRRMDRSCREVRRMERSISPYNRT
jgi:hypothetical protein